MTRPKFRGLRIVVLRKLSSKSIRLFFRILANVRRNFLYGRTRLSLEPGNATVSEYKHGDCESKENKNCQPYRVPSMWRRRLCGVRRRMECSRFVHVASSSASLQVSNNLGVRKLCMTCRRLGKGSRRRKWISRSFIYVSIHATLCCKHLFEELLSWFGSWKRKLPHLAQHMDTKLIDKCQVPKIKERSDYDF